MKIKVPANAQKHTPTPWTWEGFCLAHKEEVILTISDHGMTSADAAFIVRSANFHDKLVERLKFDSQVIHSTHHHATAIFENCDDPHCVTNRVLIEEAEGR